MTQLSKTYTKGGIDFKSVTLANDTSSYIGISYIMNDYNQDELYLNAEKKFTKLINAVSIDWNGASVPNVCSLFASDPVINNISTKGITDTSEFLYILDLLVERAVTLKQPTIKNNTSSMIQIKLGNERSIQVGAHTSTKFNPPSDTYSITIENLCEDGNWKINYGSSSVVVNTVGTKIENISSNIKEISVYSTASDVPQYAYTLNNKTGKQLTVKLAGSSYVIENNGTTTLWLNSGSVEFEMLTSVEEDFEIRDSGNVISNRISTGNHTFTIVQTLYTYVINNTANIGCNKFIIKNKNYSGEDAEHYKYTIDLLDAGTTTTFKMSSNEVYMQCNLPKNAESQASWKIGTIVVNSTIESNEHEYGEGTYNLTYDNGFTVYNYKIINGTSGTLKYKFDNDTYTLEPRENNTSQSTSQTASFQILEAIPHTEYAINTTDKIEVKNEDRSAVYILTVTGGTAKDFSITAKTEEKLNIALDSKKSLLVLGTVFPSNEYDDTFKVSYTGTTVPNSYTWKVGDDSVLTLSGTNNDTRKVTAIGVCRDTVEVTCTSKLGQSVNAIKDISVCKLTTNKPLPNKLYIGYSDTITIALEKPNGTSYAIDKIVVENSNTDAVTVTVNGNTGVTLTGTGSGDATSEITIKAKINGAAYTILSGKISVPNVEMYKFWNGKLKSGPYMATITDEQLAAAISEIGNNFIEISSVEDLCNPINESDMGYSTFIANDGNTYVARSVTRTGRKPCYMVMTRDMYDTLSGKLHSSNIILDRTNYGSEIKMMTNTEDGSAAIKDFMMDGKQYCMFGWRSINSTDVVIINPQWNLSAMFGNNN